MDKFEKPQVIDAATRAFPAGIMHLMPAHNDIPREFDSMGNPWVQWQCDWFYKGLKQMPTPKDGIDLMTAMRHLGAIQGSFEPKHEHKMAAVAYLASKWFENDGAKEKDNG